MSVKVRCKCGALLLVGEDMAGRLGKCASCGKTMRIPRELRKTGAADGREAVLKEEPRVEGAPPAAGDEHVGTLMVIQWPANYRKTLVVIVAALVVVGGVLAAVLLLFLHSPASPESAKNGERGGPVINDPDSGFSITLSEGWQVVSKQDGVTTLANAKLGASLVVTVGRRETLKEFAEEYNKRVKNLPGYKGEPDWERSSDNLGPIDRLYSFREGDSGKDVWVMVRAVSVEGKIIWFELKSDLEGLNSAHRDFLNAWKTVKAG